jgi:hypothetical protein
MRKYIQDKPRITLEQARKAWVVYSGKAYPVSSAPVEAFTAVDVRVEADIRNVIAGDLDLYARWWLLCYAQKNLKIYSSKFEAEQCLTS